MDYAKYLVEKIHTVILATSDSDGQPVTCALDIMDYDEHGLYFLTAKGKSLYLRLKQSGFASLTGIRGDSTLTRTAISVRGKTEELGNEYVSRLFEKNSYMKEIYPSEESRRALTVFRLYDGSGEWFDLSKKPIERASFAVGGGRTAESGYFITEKCIGCRECLKVCPQECIVFSDGRAHITQKNCLHCGNCMTVCRQNAVVFRG